MELPPNGQLYGLNGAVHWPTFFARTALRGIILWPIVRFFGGVGGVRGVLTAAAGGAAYTTVELAFDTTQLLAFAAQQGGVGALPQQPTFDFQQQTPAASYPQGVGSVIDVPYS